MKSSPPSSLFSDKFDWSWSLTASHFLQQSKLRWRPFFCTQCCNMLWKCRYQEKTQYSWTGLTNAIWERKPVHVKFHGCCIYEPMTFKLLFTTAPVGNLRSTCTTPYSSFPHVVCPSENMICCSVSLNTRCNSGCATHLYMKVCSLSEQPRH